MRKSLLKLLAIRLGWQTTPTKSLVILKLLWVVAGLTLSTYVSAVGMGGINVASALGQPLKADIDLVAINKVEKTSLVARLASPEAYKGAGLEYPYGNKFKFQIESRANGELYLTVRSEQPVNDPFVSILVELSWASGRLLREYTFLLDPPGYVVEQPKQAEVQTVAPAAQSASPETVARPIEHAAPVAEAPVESRAVEKPAEKPAMAAPVKQAAARTTEKDTTAGTITVQSGDTLNKIAMQNKADDVSLERMLVALYRANAEEFDGNNMNRIRAGKILRMPVQSELLNVSQADAMKEIHAHVADWNAYRQKLAAAAPATSKQQDAQQIATGKIASSVADKAPVAKESAKEVLKLSKGETPGDKVGTGAAGKTPTAQDKKNAAHEDAIAKEKALKEDQMRAALLEKNLKDMQRLTQLKAEAAALLKSSSAVVASVSPVAASPVIAASGVAAASAVKPAPVAKPKLKVVAPPPSLVDQILGEPLYLAGGAAALLGLGGIGFMLKRRKQAFVAAPTKTTATGGKNKDVGAITGQLAVPVAPSPETGDFTSTAALAKAEESAKSDDVDPISEADLFLNFGRDVQAEEILKDALQSKPGDHRIHLKLLGIYSNRKDANSFSSIARQLQDSGDEEAWQQAAAIGRKLEPNNPMYGGGAVEDAGGAAMQTTAKATEDVGSTTKQMNVFNPDFLLDDTSTAQEAPAADMDFDLGEAEKTTVLSPADMAAVQAESMDFDVTSTNPSLAASTGMDFDITSTGISVPETGGQAEAESSDMNDLVFDVTSTQPAAEPEEEHAEEKKDEDVDEDGMEFTLDFPVGEMAAKAASEPQPAEIGLADISLNLDDAATPGELASEVKDEHWHEVATKLDLAKAYHEMGDAVGAREILEEVLREGDAGQRESAQSLLDQIG